MEIFKKSVDFNFSELDHKKSCWRKQAENKFNFKVYKDFTQIIKFNLHMMTDSEASRKE